MQEEIKPVTSKQSGGWRQPYLGTGGRGGQLRICSAIDQPCYVQVSSSYYFPSPQVSLPRPLAVPGTTRSQTYLRENSIAPVAVIGSHSFGLKRTLAIPTGLKHTTEVWPQEVPAWNFLPCHSFSLIFTPWCLE